MSYQPADKLPKVSFVIVTLWVAVFVLLAFFASTRTADAHFSNEYGWQRAQTESRQNLERHRMNMEIQEQTQELRRIRESLERPEEPRRRLEDSY